LREDAAYCCRCSAVCLRVSVRHNCELRETAEPTEMPFGIWTLVRAEESCIRRGRKLPRGTGILGCGRCFESIRKGTIAMRPVATSTVEIFYIVNMSVTL